MSNKSSVFLDNILNDDQYSQVEQMISTFKKDKSQEFEVSFRGINYSNYMRIVEHYINRVAEDDIESVDSLDVSIIFADGNTYRVSFIGADTIDKFISSYSAKRPADILKYLVSLDPDENISIMYKDRGSANRIYIEDFGMVFKTTKEMPYKKGSEKPEPKGSEKILYRYKRRVSFVISDSIRLDITDVRESKSIAVLENTASNYEIELEAINPKITMNDLSDNIVSVLTVVQNSDVPIGKTESSNVISAYQNLLGLKSSTHLDSRNVISIESQHIIKFIPNRYAITDKADGERYFMVLLVDGVYLISTNMVVKKLNVAILNNSYSNTILDGELIENENGKIFLAFDVVYGNSIDFRYNKKYTLSYRTNMLNEIIDKAFGTLIPFENYTDEKRDMELDLIRQFYAKELKEYWKEFNAQLKKNKNNILISRKIYFIPFGIDPSEVFMYADMVWKLFVYGKIVPYKLDGIIYTPINSPYMIKASTENLDSVPLEYKWKSPKQNSIDFYIKIEKDEHGNEAIFYDSTVVHEAGNAYKICSLYVGIIQGNEEKPIPFKVSGKEQKANIYLKDGEARDLEGKVIEDHTVVEFIFDGFQTGEDNAYKWIPLKTRYDKTESVQKYGKKYGNNLNIAIRIWRTITNPITEENIASLANPNTYQKEIDILSKTGATRQIDRTYYQKHTDIAAGMRAFNNWIKTNMIMTYCRNKKNVLDIGCGRGGDILKFVHAGVGEYVGLDIDNNGLYVINDSASNRYKNLKKSNPNVPPMYFINADARGLFNVKSQEAIIPTMSEFNKRLIETHLSGNKKYSIINNQFTIHYYLSDQISWSNYCKNINNHIDTNGYFLVTCFDGKLIHDKLFGKQKMTVSYTDNKGRKNVFFEINKIYNDSDKNNIGLAIDLYNSLISNQGTYLREYLVMPDFLIKSLKDKCGLELIETDSFFSLFNLYKNYFTQESSDIVRDTGPKRYKDIKNFYYSLDRSKNLAGEEEYDIAMASFKLSMLNRYFIFKKTKNIDITESSRIVGVNHKINLGKLLMPYFETNRMFIEPEKKTTQINKIYHAIRRKHTGIQPTVYLIRHTISDNSLDNEIYKRNRLQFSKVKEGNDPKTLLIYKSPDRNFYPINYNNGKEKVYLLDSTKIVDDLDILVALSDKIGS